MSFFTLLVCVAGCSESDRHGARASGGTIVEIEAPGGPEMFEGYDGLTGGSGATGEVCSSSTSEVFCEPSSRTVAVEITEGDAFDAALREAWFELEVQRAGREGEWDTLEGQLEAALGSEAAGESLLIAANVTLSYEIGNPSSELREATCPDDVGGARSMEVIARACGAGPVVNVSRGGWIVMRFGLSDASPATRDVLREVFVEDVRRGVVPLEDALRRVSELDPESFAFEVATVGLPSLVEAASGGDRLNAGELLDAIRALNEDTQRECLALGGGSPVGVGVPVSWRLGVYSQELFAACGLSDPELLADAYTCYVALFDEDRSPTNRWLIDGILEHIDELLALDDAEPDRVTWGGDEPTLRGELENLRTRINQCVMDFETKASICRAAIVDDALVSAQERVDAVCGAGEDTSGACSPIPGCSTDDLAEPYHVIMSQVIVDGEAIEDGM